MSQLPIAYLTSMKRSMLDYQTIRRDVIKQSGDALHQAKKAIFAFHRGDTKTGTAHLDEAVQCITVLLKQHKKNKQMQEEGAFRAAVEEIVEATLFLQFLEKKTLKKITTVPVADDVFVAGLADVPGELYRYALKMGTEHNIEEVERAKQLAEEIVESLIEFDLTKHLRNKFDQAKAAHSKIEKVQYELCLHG